MTIPSAPGWYLDEATSRYWFWLGDRWASHKGVYLARYTKGGGLAYLPAPTSSERWDALPVTADQMQPPSVAGLSSGAASAPMKDRQFCSACGASVGRADAFCASCGAKLTAPKRDQPATSSPAAVPMSLPTTPGSTRTVPPAPAPRPNWLLRNRLAVGVLTIMLGGVMVMAATSAVSSTANVISEGYTGVPGQEWMKDIRCPNLTDDECVAKGRQSEAARHAKQDLYAYFQVLGWVLVGGGVVLVGSHVIAQRRQ